MKKKQEAVLASFDGAPYCCCCYFLRLVKARTDTTATANGAN